MYACLAVPPATCTFWQNDRDFLRATVVTRGWNGYRNKSQHRKSTLEKKILPPFQQGFEPATFQSRVRCSNHWAIPAPLKLYQAASFITAHTAGQHKIKIKSLFGSRRCSGIFSYPGPDSPVYYMRASTPCCFHSPLLEPKPFRRTGRMGERGYEDGGRGRVYIPVATLSPPEWPAMH